MIPEGWTEATVGELANFTNGHGFEPSDWATEGLPIVRIQNLNGSKNFNYYRGMPEPGWLVEPGTLLFAWAGVKGVSFGPRIWDGPLGVLNQHIYRLEVSNRIDRTWFYEVLMVITREIERKAHGFKSSLVHVHKSDITDQPIQVPPLPEQRKIAAILGTWDEAIALTERRIAAGQQRKQGLMQRLLTGQVRFPEFVDEPGIAPPLEQKVPIGWRALRFGNVVSLGSRKFDPQVDPTPLPCVELEHISQGTGVILGSVPANAQRSIKNRFVAGQILFGKLRPYLRKYARPEFDGVCSSEIWVFSANQDICDSSYLFYFVQSEDFISSASISSGTKMPRADWGLVSEAIFALPSIAEQRRIVEVLAACDRELDLLERKRDALQRQKRGLMQQLLTGRVRVKE